MDKLNFYTVNMRYVDFLKDTELEKRGFSRVPSMDYGAQRKPKFLCGVVLQVNSMNYYVPVTSYKQQKPDNFLIKSANGQVVSSLRFNYMFPVPDELLSVRIIADEPDRAYRALLSQELRYCIKNQETIQHLAIYTDFILSAIVKSKVRKVRDVIVPYFRIGQFHNTVLSFVAIHWWKLQKSLIFGIITASTVCHGPILNKMKNFVVKCVLGGVTEMDMHLVGSGTDPPVNGGVRVC